MFPGRRVWFWGCGKGQLTWSEGSKKAYWGRRPLSSYLKKDEELLRPKDSVYARRTVCAKALRWEAVYCFSVRQWWLRKWAWCKQRLAVRQSKASVIAGILGVSFHSGSFPLYQESQRTPLYIKPFLFGGAKVNNGIIRLPSTCLLNPNPSEHLHFFVSKCP